MVNLHEIWRRITATRYTRALEAEVARLRAENHALLNSILGIAGVPPITVVVPPDTSTEVFSAGARPTTAHLQHVIPPADAAPPAVPASTKPGRAVRRPSRMRVKPPSDAAVPMRRRSWHQIYRMLELDSANKQSSQSTVDS
jgi:hypothetical protein